MDSKQLEVIEQRLLRERARSLRALGALREETSLFREPAEGTGSASPDRMLDRATLSAEREKSLLLAGREGRYLYRVEDALRRLYRDPEGFGICQECGREIPFERLEALPHVRFCLDCKLREEQDAA